jgi:drug/metabolite transporter (DMT)-like permease
VNPSPTLEVKSGAAPPPVHPLTALLAAVVVFSWAGPLVRFTDAPALAVSFWRLFMAVTVIAAILTFRGQGWRPVRALSRQDWVAALGAGVLLAFHFWSWIASVQFTSVASSVILVSTQPLFVALLSAFLIAERPKKGEWVGMGVAFLGAVVIGWGDFSRGAHAIFGDALALSAAFLAASYYVVGRTLRGRVDLWTYVFVVYGAATLVLGVAILALPGVSFVSGYGKTDWAVFLALALGPMLLGHTAINYSLRYIRAYMANLAVLGEPVGATLIAWLLPAIAEAPTPATFAGGGLILVGIGIALFRGR